MKKLFIKIVYNFFLFFDFLSGKILLFKMFEQSEKKSYIKKKILNQEVNFFIPNQIIAWRVKTLFTQEPETIEWINNFDNNLNTFWDVGGNIGLYSIYATLKFRNINVVSFEPSFNNLPILSRNIFINNLQNKITICQIPLSEKINKFL